MSLGWRHLVSIHVCVPQSHVHIWILLHFWNQYLPGMLGIWYAVLPRPPEQDSKDAMRTP
jgi:hypothetical protein